MSIIYINFQFILRLKFIIKNFAFNLKTNRNGSLKPPNIWFV